MATGTQRDPQTYATIADAQAAAVAASTLVWALVGGELYQVYPGGRTIKWATREKVA